jgi:hypothetical protein
MRLDALTAEHFYPYTGARFRVTSDSLEMELIEVTVLRPAAAEGLRAPFALIFRGPHDPVLAQRVHVVENRELGALQLFLVPIGPEPAGMRYEAVFG